MKNKPKNQSTPSWIDNAATELYRIFNENVSPTTIRMVIAEHYVPIPKGSMAAVLKKERDEALSALRSLHDEQNGAPRAHREAFWTASMTEAQRVLAKSKA